MVEDDTEATGGCLLVDCGCCAGGSLDGVVEATLTGRSVL